MNIMEYSTRRVGKEKSAYNAELSSYFKQIKDLITDYKVSEPYLGLRIAGVELKEPYLSCAEYELISLVVMLLLMKYVYNTNISNIRFYYCKFTIVFTIIIPKGIERVSFTVDRCISLLNDSGFVVPNRSVYSMILEYLTKKGEEYKDSKITAIKIRVYMKGLEDKELSFLTDDDINPDYDDVVSQIIELLNEVGGEPPEPPKTAVSRKRPYSKYITELKPRGKIRHPFIVADMETVLIKDVHVPYAAGFLALNPGDNVSGNVIETYFSEDHIFFKKEFVERSNQMLFDFLERLAQISSERKIRTVYFHNFSRFDGIILLKYYTSHGKKYTIKPLMRNHNLYELVVYRKKKVVFRLRDSLNLLPSSLATLGKTLCPELGPKGDIKHDELEVSNLKLRSVELLEYMKQDIRLLGGVMLKAQDIYWNQYNVDIENVMTLSTLAMSIFRLKYYDSNTFPIHIPSRNEDTFIRRGYYGGHADTYIPCGEKLYYYDVNSLYPHIMKTFHMPGGQPVWDGNLMGRKLSELYGFIEAYIYCPNTIKRPFLPFKDKNNTLLFPTGEFIGVYYTEELLFAERLGYNIIPLKGYLFEKKVSPFEGFVSELYSRRQEAKRDGNDAMSYIYKILMNSLYGRFGINPESLVTEICNKERYDFLIKKGNISTADKLSEDYFIVSYTSNSVDVVDSDWKAPRISAVQLSAAITACARIYMHEFISRDDCYYTDTDSAVLGSPLPEDKVSSTTLGMLKLEYTIDKAIFLAPKSYILYSDGGGVIMKHKGAAKSLVHPEWFNSQYADPSQTNPTNITANFRIDWHNLSIGRKDYVYNLGIRLGTKRDPIYDNNNLWVDTKPKEVKDLGGYESIILNYKLKLIKDEYNILKRKYTEQNQQQGEHIASLESELAKVSELIQSRSANQEAVNPANHPEETVSAHHPEQAVNPANHPEQAVNPEEGVTHPPPGK